MNLRMNLTRLTKILIGFSITACFSSMALAEDIQFECAPRSEHTRPYVNLTIYIYDADSHDPTSEIEYVTREREGDPETESGVLPDFALGEARQVSLTHGYRMIRIDGYDYDRSGTLQLQKITGTRYRALFDLPEGSDALHVGWGRSLAFLCERVL